MFNIHIDYAKTEVARRHEPLARAQRNGTAFEPRRWRSSWLATVRGWFGRAKSPAAAPAASATTNTSEPCVTC